MNRSEWLRHFHWVLIALALSGTAARADCVLSVGPMNFGTYDVLNPAPLDSLATVTYSCTAVVGPVMSLSAGTSGTYSPRQMVQLRSALSYNLYLDAARTIVWGDGTAGTSTFPCLIGTSLTVNIFGRVFAQQNLPVGPYADSIVATIVF